MGGVLCYVAAPRLTSSPDLLCLVVLYLAGLAADGKMTWLIDFVGYNSKNSPPFKISLQVLSILQVRGWQTVCTRLLVPLPHAVGCSWLLCTPRHALRGLLLMSSAGV
jgi:hypothetical protein